MRACVRLCVRVCVCVCVCVRVRIFGGGHAAAVWAVIKLCSKFLSSPCIGNLADMPLAVLGPDLNEAINSIRLGGYPDATEHHLA